MFFPLGTDRPPRRRPVITEWLIVVNLFVYLLGVAGQYLGWLEFEKLVDAGHYWKLDFHAWQLITYQFLHDPSSIWHVAFNMLFLWVFGSAVEDRMTRTGFLVFYLIAGVFAGIAHGSVSDAPIIGASGAIAGVTGAFLALFPRSHIKVLFFIFGIFSIPSLWFIGFYFVIDLLRQTGELLGGPDEQRVAYMAHLGGYVFGFGVAFALLGLRIVRREEFDVFFLFKQSRRRAAFRAAQHKSRGAVWDKPHLDAKSPVPKPASKAPEMTEKEKRQSAQRAEINRLLADHQFPPAADLYRNLLHEAPNTVFAEDRQMDLANQLYAEADHNHAAAAYELLLDSYPSGHRATEVRLILGLIYARQLNRPQRAKELIEKAKELLRDEGQLSLADQLLAELAT